MASRVLAYWCSASIVLAFVTESAAFALELGESFAEHKNDGVWLVDFYAPWCGHCKKLEPVWNEVAQEMKASGSPVRVGKLDATAHSGIATEYGVRGYPTIKLIKGDLSYNYKGPRTKDEIIAFANRVAGPAMRHLSTPALFAHTQSRHDIFFLYVGGDSKLKESFTQVALEMVVNAYFFSTPEEVLPTNVHVHEAPAALVFKDGTYYEYDESDDGDLATWVRRERFPTFQAIDGYAMYAISDTGKLVVLAIVDPMSTEENHSRLKKLVEDVAHEYREHFHRDFQFGYVDGAEGYMNNLLMSDVEAPSLLVFNTSSQEYYLPTEPLLSNQDLLSFINNILDGSVPAHGGDGLGQKIKRMLFELKATITEIFHVTGRRREMSVSSDVARTQESTHEPRAPVRVQGVPAAGLRPLRPATRGHQHHVLLDVDGRRRLRRGGGRRRGGPAQGACRGR
ncbi:protein disulfide-isomerase TMX3-like isoform X3 [Lampetra fluviatilis]